MRFEKQEGIGGSGLNKDKKNPGACFWQQIFMGQLMAGPYMRPTETVASGGGLMGEQLPLPAC